MSEISKITLLGCVQISQLPACCVLYLILVSFWKNRQTFYGARGWYDLLRGLRGSYSDIVGETIIKKYYERKPRYVDVIILFLFFCWLFEISHTEMAEFVTHKDHGFWRRFLPIHSRILKTVSEFLGTSGQHVDPADLSLCFERLIARIFEIVRADQISDEDLFAYCRHVTFCSRSAGNGALPENATGGQYFANMIFSLGMGAALALCQKDEAGSDERMLTGFGYSVTQLVCAILSNPGAKNVTQLAKEFRNSGDFFSGLRPSAQVLRKFVTSLDKDKVVSFYERFVRSVRHFKRFSKIMIAVDATIIEVFGDYEDAKRIYDHDQSKYVKGYKLYLLFDVTNSIPVSFLLASSESECTKLLGMVEKAKQLVGADNIEFILFDRGYFDTDRFATLDDNSDKFITPGKQCKTFKDIIAYFENDMSLYEQTDETEWRVTFYLANFINFASDSEWKWARITIRRRLVTKIRKDPKTGEAMTETQVQHSIYMTNILDGSAEDVIKTYGKRVAIENFFEELKNAYFVKGFPTTSYDSVAVYITLALISHLLLWLFCSFLTAAEGEHPYCHRELSTLKPDVLERPADELFDCSEAADADVLAIQRAIERDIVFIRNFRRFIQRTKHGRRKLSLTASLRS